MGSPISPNDPRLRDGRLAPDPPLSDFDPMKGVKKDYGFFPRNLRAGCLYIDADSMAEFVPEAKGGGQLQLLRELVAIINHTAVGKTLLREIDALSSKLQVHVSVSFMGYGCDAQILKGSSMLAGAVPIDPHKAFVGANGRPGPGTGTAIVARTTSKCPDRNPPDAVLFHELVHALRNLKGMNASQISVKDKAFEYLFQSHEEHAAWEQENLYRAQRVPKLLTKPAYRNGAFCDAPAPFR